jgi:hypothetical protein
MGFSTRSITKPCHLPLRASAGGINRAVQAIEKTAPFETGNPRTFPTLVNLRHRKNPLSLPTFPTWIGYRCICSHLQVVAALLVGGWMVHTDQLEVGGVVAFISGAGRLNDPWGDLVNYFRDFSVTQVKYDLVADRVNQLSDRWTTVPADQRTALGIEA